MSHQLNYRRPEKQPDQGFYWRDTLTSVWQQVIGVVVCGLTGVLLPIWFMSVIGYWLGVTVISVRGIRPSLFGLDQVFVKWGFPILFICILAVLFAAGMVIAAFL